MKSLYYFDQAFLDIHINQNNINTNLLDAVATDDVFMVSAKDSPDFTRTWDNDVCYHTGAYIEINIADKAQPYTVPAINDFFFSKLTNAHIITNIKSWFIICRKWKKVAFKGKIPEDDNYYILWYNKPNSRGG
jgi:hypothetical protein